MSETVLQSIFHVTNLFGKLRLVCYNITTEENSFRRFPQLTIVLLIIVNVTFVR